MPARTMALLRRTSLSTPTTAAARESLPSPHLILTDGSLAAATPPTSLATVHRRERVGTPASATTVAKSATTKQTAQTHALRGSSQARAVFVSRQVTVLPVRLNLHPAIARVSLLTASRLPREAPSGLQPLQGGRSRGVRVHSEPSHLLRQEHVCGGCVECR